MDVQAGLNSLTSFDYVVLGILFLSGILALIRGFVREALSIAAWVGAYVLAARYYTLAEPYAHQHFKSHSTVAIVSGVGMFVAVLLVLTIAGWFLARTIVRGRALNLIDRSLGFGFGLVRGALVLCIIYMATVSVLWPDLDKAQPNTPSIVIETKEEARAIGEKATGEKERDIAPTWLVRAKTRPALTYGAQMLKSFIPQREIERTSAQYLEEKKNAQRIVDDKALEMLSTPVPSGSTVSTTPTYDTTSRDNLNHLVNQKANP